MGLRGQLQIVVLGNSTPVVVPPVVPPVVSSGRW